MKRNLALVSLVCSFTACCFGQAPAQATAKIRVACVGDSITAGGYPAVLGKLLGAGYEVRNLGVSGATLLKKGDFSYWNQGKIQEAAAFGPQIVTLMLGTNDAKPQNYHRHADEFLNDYKALIAAFKALPSKPQVYAMIPVPAFGNGGYGIDGTVLHNEISPVIVKAAQETGTETIDLFTPLADSPGLFPDNIHPNGDGAEAIAKRLYQALTGAPVFESDGAVFLDSLSVKIVALGSNTIHFTTDGTEPTERSPIYKAPIELSATTTIKALTVGAKTSPVAEGTFSKVKPLEPVGAVKTEPGLAFAYYEDNDAKALEDLAKLTPLRTGTTNDLSLAATRARPEYWGYRWTGFITAPRDGLYTFHTSSDDGSRLWIGDTLVVDNGGEHGGIERLGKIALKAGAHPIAVTFYNSRSGWSLRVEWEGPGLPKQVIPAAVLSHGAAKE